MAKFLVFFLCMVILTKSHLILAISEAPMAAPRKLGKEIVLGNKPAASRLRSAAEAPRADERGVASAEVSASGEETTAPAGQEEEMKSNHHRRHSTDKSVAGGGVIVGGLATTFLVAIFCYIRATGRKAAEPGSPTNSDSTVGGRNGKSGSPVIL